MEYCNYNSTHRQNNPRNYQNISPTTHPWRYQKLIIKYVDLNGLYLASDPVCSVRVSYLYQRY